MKLKLQLAITLVLCLNFSAFAQVTSSNEVAARNWIKANESELKIQPFHTFKLSFVRKGETGETLRFQQMVNNVPVFQSEIVLHFSTENKVVFSSNSFDASIQNIATTPSISKETALAKSTESLRISGEYVIADNSLIVTKVNDATKLAYKVITNPTDGSASWEVLVDAQTGAILGTKDIALYHHHEKKPKKPIKISPQADKNSAIAPLAYVTGTAMVYMSDPLSFAQATYGQTGYTDNNDANSTQLAAARSSVTLPEIDLTAGVYKLKSSYIEITDFETPNKGLFTQATNAFSFTRDNDGFEAANVFYQLDKSLRYINQTLGVACLPNTNGGVLRFDPSGFQGQDNSHFLTATDQISFGEGCVDDAEDADVILHELGHGLHDWMTNGGLSQVNGLSEGCGDYWAQSYSRSLNQWNSSQPAYHYVFSWDGHQSECWAGRTTDYGALYPGGLVNQIHTDGQIWATCLMRIWDAIGRVKTDTSFLEGLALTNSSSSQQTAAIAVRQAAINRNYPCADIQVMTNEFTATGYTMPTLPLTMAPIANQTVTSASYTSPSYAALANPISPLCVATLTQSPPAGTVFTPGVYTITMTATLGAATVVRTFTLTVLGLGVDENIKINTVVFPNPATNQITIKGEFDANESVSVFNLLGQKVLDHNINSNEETINISKLATGVYTIYFNTSKESYKFIKE